jgi:hypothetical protein
VNTEPAIYQTEAHLISSNNNQVHWADSLKVSFDVSDYDAVMFKILADSLPVDSTMVYLASSGNGSWVSGNVAFFDRDPSTTALDGWPAAYGTAGTFVPKFGRVIWPVNAYGATLLGPYIHVLVVTSAHTHRWHNLNIWAICKK